MPFVDPTGSILGTLTDLGRNAVAKSILPGEGFAFMLSGFKVGREGYVDANPVLTTAVDPAATDLADPVFPASGLHPFESIETIISPQTIAPVCRLDPDDTAANYALGELGIFATILQSNTPSEIGTDFMFAITHFPILAKTNKHTLVWRVVIAL